MILDLYLEPLKYKIRFIDTHLESLEREAEASSDPDMFGIYDTSEDIKGFGFVACQKYIRSTACHYKIEIKNALDLGPKHRTGRSFVCLIDGYANYWKHEGEKLHKKTKETVESIGIKVCNPYPVADGFYKMVNPQPLRFSTLLPLLKEWRDEVRRKAQ